MSTTRPRFIWILSTLALSLIVVALLPAPTLEASYNALLSGMTGTQGNGVLLQRSTGSTTPNDCVKYDVNGNTVDSGSACSAGGGAPTTSKYVIGAADGTLTNALVWPSLYNSPNAPPASRNAMDEECDGASLNSPNNIWTWTAQGSTVETQAQGWCTLTFVSNGAAHAARFIGQTLPSPPYTFVAKLSTHLVGSFSQAGIILYESGTSKWIEWGFTANGAYLLAIGKSDGTVPFSVTFSGAVPAPITPIQCMAVNRTTTTLTFYTSSDCITFDQQTTRTITTDFTAAPDTIGMGGDPYQQPEVLNFDYFRRKL